MKRSSSQFVLWLAWRDLRAQPAGFRLYALALALGVGAMVAITSFRDSMTAALDAQSRTLLGADLAVRTRRPLGESAERYLAALPAERAQEVTFRTMLFFPDSGKTRFVQVRALEGNFPFYGALETEPPEAVQSFRGGAFVLVEENVLIQSGARVGDRVKLGEREFVLAGSLRKAPGETPAEAFMAPRVYIPLAYVADTKLLQPGSVASYRQYLRLIEPARADELAAALRVDLKAERIDVDTAAGRKKALLGSVDQLARYMNLVGLVALLLGCIGTAGAVHVYLQRRLGTIAYLRCLGAPASTCERVFLLQVVALAAAGIVLGLAASLVVMPLAPRLARDFLPAAVPVTLNARAAISGVLAGFGLSVGFALLPLLAVRRVSPLRALVSFPHERVAGWWSPSRLAVLVALALGVVLYAWRQTGHFVQGLLLTAGLGAALGLLALLARGLRALARLGAGRLVGAAWRQGVAGLYRPGNQTALMMTAVGLGVFLLATLHVCERSLLQRLSVYRGADQPTLVLIDIQADQREAVADLVKAHDLPVQHVVPIVTMRLLALNGRDVQEVQEDAQAGVPEWALRREYRSTYREQLLPTETIEAGTWISSWQADAVTSAIPISLERSIAETLKVNVGDALTWDVQGVPMNTRVASLRHVDWQSMKPNFYALFPAGVLEDAPQTRALFTRVTDAARSAGLQRDVAEQFPNVSAIDIALVLASVNSILGRIATVIRVVALFVLAAGFLVLVGAVRANREHRARERALLRALGASRRHLLTLALVEYGSLGVLGSLGGVLLAAPASAALCHFLFKTDTQFDAPALLAGVAIAGLTTILLGLAGAGRGLDRPPLEALRSVEG